MVADFIEKLKNRAKTIPLFAGTRRGVEREGLRVTANAQPALTPHPRALGDKLINPYITTDFSENLLELITPPSHDIHLLFTHLSRLHTLTRQVLHHQHEWLWPNSMPCALEDEQIPIARFGTGFSARIKETYRRGLAYRYGKPMQAIAGIHYNFSFSTAFWQEWYQLAPRLANEPEKNKDLYYFHIMRNHMRHVWILTYFFGASSACHPSLITGRTLPSGYLEQRYPDTLIGPQACSLRMTPIGYYSFVQKENLAINFNTPEAYLASLRQALETVYPPYVAIEQAHGESAQLNTHLLQIEAEFYHPIRPKSDPTHPGRPLDALGAHGVDYLEVRAIDINPFHPFGIAPEQVLFLDVYLLFCLLEESPDLVPTDDAWVQKLHRVAAQGRSPEIRSAIEAELTGLFPTFYAIAALLDAEQADGRYQAAIQYHEACLHKRQPLLSEQVLSCIDNAGSFSLAMLNQAQKY